MQRQLTPTGIPALPEVSWGAHLCLFYSSHTDLLEILVPYVRLGLINNEFCLVVADDREERELVDQLRSALPDLAAYIAKGALEIMKAQESYGGGRDFDPQATIKFWHRKAEEATRLGFSGMRANGDESWLDEGGWKDFIEYEAALDRAIADLPAVILCAYPLASRTPLQILDAAQAHQVVVAKRDGTWNVLELAEVARTKQELRALSSELERRVLERTYELRATNERLCSEIAQRNRVERALRESEERFAKAFKSSPLVMTITRYDDGRIIDVNDAFVRTFGYERGDAVGRSVAELGVWRDRADAEKPLNLLKMQSLTLHGYELLAKTKSGQSLDIVLFTEVIDIGGHRCLLAASYDETARKQAERCMLEQQWLLNESERLSHTGSWQWRLGDGKTMWSRELYRIHGYEPGMFTPSYEAWLMRVHPQDRSIVKAAVDDAVAKRTAFSIEHRIVLPDGQIRYLRSVGYCHRDEAKNELKMTGYATDITERREAEQALKTARQELQALSRKLVNVQESERRELSRDLHDRVGQNLTALGINLDLVRNRLVNERSLPDSQEILGRLEDASVLLEATVSSVADVVSELRPPVLDELGLVAAVEWYASGFTRRTGIKTNVESHGPHDRVPADAELTLFRIVQEALTNVSKHAKAQSVVIESRVNGQTYTLSVCDDGIGVHSRTDRDDDIDHGFGIAIMRERAQSLGGLFEFSSRPEGGSCAIVRLPLR